MYLKAGLQEKPGADKIWNQLSVLGNIFGGVEMKSVTNKEIADHLDLKRSFTFHCLDFSYTINVVS